MTITITPDLTDRYIRCGKCNQCGWCCKQENCKYLETRDNVSACKIYDSPDRPLRCGLYPEMPPVLHKNCGYYFLDTWENNKVVKGKL